MVTPSEGGDYEQNCFICRKHAGLEAAPPGGYIFEDANWKVGHGPAHLIRLGTLSQQQNKRSWMRSEYTMLDQLLIMLGATIFGLLGLAHLFFLYATDKFLARDRSVVTAMQQTSPVLTSKITMWQAWVGFNASHSLGALLLAVFYLALAGTHIEIIRETPIFIIIAIVVSLVYLYLAYRYWFRTPLLGIALATACFALAAVRMLFY